MRGKIERDDPAVTSAYRPQHLAGEIAVDTDPVPVVVLTEAERKADRTGRAELQLAGRPPGPATTLTRNAIGPQYQVPTSSSASRATPAAAHSGRTGGSFSARIRSRSAANADPLDGVVEFDSLMAASPVAASIRRMPMNPGIEPVCP